MMRIDILRHLLEGKSLHFPKTVSITLRGPGAIAKANPAWLASVLQGPGGIPASAIEELYRFQNPGKWFFTPTSRMTDSTYEGLHGKKLKVPGTEMFLELEHVNKERARVTIHWLPKTYPMAAVKEVIKVATGDADAEVYPLKNEEGKWVALCRPKREVPHYGLVDEPGANGKKHCVKFTMPGRLTECQYCGDTSHWSNQCQGKRQRSQPNNVFKDKDFPSLHNSKMNGKQSETPMNAAATTTKETEESEPTQETTTAEEVDSELAMTQTIEENETERDKQEESSEEGYRLVTNKSKKRKARSRASSDSDSEQKRQELCPDKKSLRNNKKNNKNEAGEDEEEERNSSNEEDYFSSDMTDTDTQEDGPDEKQLLYSDVLK